jgi:hypothetical protein
VIAKVWLGGASIALAKLGVIGQGGEADVYDLGDGRVLKLFKAPDHPDVAGVAELEAAATHRLAEAAAKLRGFPAGLPARVVKPHELATRTKKPDDVVGYAMPKVDGEAMFHLAEPHWRRAHPIAADTVVAVLRDLHATVDAVHRAGVVIGDFPDTHVIVAGERAWLIDADSWQYGRWRATMFSERFVDPRLCAADALQLILPHDPDGDWFAFTTMLVRCLLWTGPYGGVFAPADPKRRVPQTTRALHRISIFDPDVLYPKASVPWQVLPDELIEHLREVFERDRRGRFPAALLDRLRFRRCSCGAEHARTSCPVCRTVVAMPAAVIRGRVRATRIDPATIVQVPRTCWLAGGTLMRQTPFGPEAIGQVLAGATRIWAGESLGVGLWRAGGYSQAFVFRPDRRGLRDGIAIPRIRGALLDVHAVCGVDRVWLWWREALAGRETLCCTAISATGEILGVADAPADDAGWLASVPGACAVGPLLFVPTDAGIVRVDADGAGALVQTRSFPDTADFVTAADVLHPAPGGLDVRTRDGAVRLTLS